jgi:hypothetical protein
MWIKFTPQAIGYPMRKRFRTSLIIAMSSLALSSVMVNPAAAANNYTVRVTFSKVTFPGVYNPWWGNAEGKRYTARIDGWFHAYSPQPAYDQFVRMFDEVEIGEADRFPNGVNSYDTASNGWYSLANWDNCLAYAKDGNKGWFCGSWYDNPATSTWDSNPHGTNHNSVLLSIYPGQNLTIEALLSDVANGDDACRVKFNKAYTESELKTLNQSIVLHDNSNVVTDPDTVAACDLAVLVARV